MATEKERIIFELPNISFHIKTLSLMPDKAYRGIHSHNAIEILKVKSGQVNCLVNEKEYLLKQDDIIIINRNIIHKIDVNVKRKCQKTLI